MSERLRSKGYLRVSPTANNQRQGITWAADHRLPSPAELFGT